MLREEVLNSWNNLKAQLTKQKEYLAFYQRSPFLQIASETPREIIKQHQNINFLVLDSTWEKKDIINLNELGVKTQDLQSIWLNYSLIGKDINPQQIIFTSSYGKNIWKLHPQYTSALGILFGRKIYFLRHNAAGVEASPEGKMKKITAHLEEEIREKDYRHTLHLNPELERYD